MKKNLELILCYFMFTTEAVNGSKECYPENMKFVFKLEDINRLENVVKKYLRNNILEEYDYYLYQSNIDKTISTIKNNLNEYSNNRNENINYIFIDDIERFSGLLYKLIKSFENKEKYGNNLGNSIINEVWLRMSPSEVNDVYAFLERQIEFNQNKDYELTDTELINSGKYNDFSVNYKIDISGCWFETNKKMSIYLVQDNKKIVLPEVYFEIAFEDGKKVCYVYAIQNPKHLRDNPNNVEASFVKVKKQLRNKYTNYKFILALELFIKTLKEKGIYDIKVPLLQVFNYDYHVSMSKTYKKRLQSYEKKIKDGKMSSDDSLYTLSKKTYDKIIDKEDIISKNKTERLLGTFIALEEINNSIEITNEPFIQGDNLVVKILELQKTKIK